MKVREGVSVLVLAALCTGACGRPVALLNDADAAGLAEATFGAAAADS